MSIIGGLGNQMFQYALGRKLSIQTKQDLKYDVSAFNTYKTHRYCLDSFNIKGKIATKPEIKKIKYKKNNLLSTIMRTKEYSSSVVTEDIFAFNKNVLNVEGDRYLEGYWQSEKYFLDIRQVLIDDFSLRKEVSIQGRKHLKKINEINSVSMHIRRGDYSFNNEAAEVHGICSNKYYADSMAYIEKKVENPVYYVFSDDQEWAKKEVQSKLPIHFMDFNGLERNYEDIYLMSKCKFNIIANSSFSWWGAWLNQYDKKIVVAPKQWFKDFDYVDADLIPSDWIRF